MKRKLLIVDDDQPVREYLEKVLREHYETKCAESGASALAMFGEGDFDIVLTDVRMPGLGGVDILRTLKKISENTEIILMTGFADISAVTESLNEGAFAFVTKPVDVKYLLHRLNQAVSVIHGREMEKEVVENMKNELLMQTLFTQRLASLAVIAGGITHEINQPLSGIGLYVATLKSMASSGELLNPSQVVEIAEKIESQIKRMSGIIEHMREFSSDTKNKEIWKVNLLAIVKRSSELFNVQMNKSGISLEVDIPEDLAIRANPGRFEQVLINLVYNARDSILEKAGTSSENQPQKKICIKGREDGESINVDITDTGNGVPEKIKDRIFEPFVSGKNSGKGTGLGLSICKRILEDFEAEIKLLETGPEGTTFRVIFKKAK
ncbi:MAG: hybrid sensor histidine kinase/response regulator [Nitrospinota bacterium]|nr:hybrid sensor histidine kinase/response regulator [Nitrospinota bacterium]